MKIQNLIAALGACVLLSASAADPCPVSENLRGHENIEWVQKLNEIGRKVAAEFTQDVDDLFALLDPLDRAQNWSDTFHHKGAVREKEADQVAASVLSVLAR